MQEKQKGEPAAAPSPSPAAPKQESQQPDKPAAPAPRNRRRRGEGVSYEDIPNSQIRKIIAKRLLESKLNVPHYYLRGHADLATVNSLRQTLKEQGSKVGVAGCMLHDASSNLSDSHGCAFLTKAALTVICEWAFIIGIMAFADDAPSTPVYSVEAGVHVWLSGSALQKGGDVLCRCL